LDARLHTSEELSGLLNFALKGLKRLKANKWKFTYKRKTVEDVEIMYKRLSEPVVAFLMDKCEEDYDAYLEKAVFYNEFKKYSIEHGSKPISQSKFWRSLKDQSEIPVQADYRPDNFSPRYVKGVTVKGLAQTL
jgi:phage/plasmid-associated DNA primase